MLNPDHFGILLEALASYPSTNRAGAPQPTQPLKTWGNNSSCSFILPPFSSTAFGPSVPRARAAKSVVNLASSS